MNLEPRLVALPFILSAGISLLVALLIFQRQNVKGGVPLALLLLEFALWAGANAVRVSLVEPAAQVPWLRLSDAALMPAALTFLIFVAQFTDTDHWLSNVNLLLLSIGPFLTIFLIAMNEAHGLYYASFHLVSINGFAEMIPAHGAWFWVNAAFSYLFILAASVMLVRALLHTGPFLRVQLITVLIGCLLPLGMSAYALLSPASTHTLEMTSLAVAASGLLFAFALFRQRLLDIAPVARSLLFEKLGDAVLVLDAGGHIVDLNTAAQQMLQLRKDAYGRTLEEVVPQWRDLASTLERYMPEAHFELQGRLDPSRFFDVSFISLLDSRGRHNGYLISLRDISQRKRAEMEVQRMNVRLRRQVSKISSLHEELREQAIRDALTGLYNRRYLDETLEREFSRARRGGYPISIILMDIDEFKRVNDTYGHKAGDRVLRQFGEIIRLHVRTGDIPCRFGGEEFVIVMPETSLDIAFQRAEQIRRRFASTRFFKVQDGVVPTLSIGIAVYPTHGRSEEKVLHAADQAMYLAKARGGDQAVRYDSRQKTAPLAAFKDRSR